MRSLIALCLGAAVLGAGTEAAWPQRATTQKAVPLATTPANKADANAWTVGLAGGLLEGTFIRYAADIAKVLDDGDNLRVIPLVTYGAVGNVNDLLYLKGVDAAITQADVLDHFKKELNVPRIDERVHYISPLYHSEVHVCARPEFRTLKDLEGKKVNFNTRGSAANLTGQIVFRRLNINVEPLFLNNSVAVEQMRKGDVAAVVHVVGKPNELFVNMKGEVPCRLLPVQYDQVFADFYLPTSLKREDYPTLIPAGEEVATIAVPTVLAVFNWAKNSERYAKVAKFIEAFFGKFEQLHNPPYQPKWKEINLAAKVPGWTRYPVAEAALAKLAGPDQTAQARSQFETFLNSRGGRRDAPLTAQEREALFNEFLKWQRR